MDRDVTTTAPHCSTAQFLLSQWLHWSLTALLILFQPLIRTSPYTFLCDWVHKLVIWIQHLLQGCLGGLSVWYTPEQCWWELPERDVSSKSSLQHPGVNTAKFSGSFLGLARRGEKRKEEITGSLCYLTVTFWKLKKTKHNQKKSKLWKKTKHRNNKTRHS